MPQQHPLAHRAITTALLLLLALLPFSAACKQTSLTLPASNVSITHPSHPLLLYTTPLAALPLSTLSSHPGLAVAAPTSSTPPTERDVRAALRAGVHVALPAGLSPHFLAATGREALLSQAAAAPRPEDKALIVVALDRAPANGTVLFNEDATAYVGALGDDSDYPEAPRKVSALEAALPRGELHCAYDHWWCDYTAPGEVLHPLCQRLRRAYLLDTGIDLFKFAPRSSLPTTAIKLSASVPPSDAQRRHPFIEHNRARVEDAYARLVSQGETAEAPIRQIMFILFGASDDALAAARGVPGGLEAVVREAGAAERYEDVRRGRWRGALRMVGLFLVILGGARGCLGGLGGRGAGGRGAIGGGGMGRAGGWRTAGQAAEKTAGAMTMPRFLESRVQNFSKTS